MITIKDESIEKFTVEDPVERDQDIDMEDEDNRVYLWLCWGLVGIIALCYLFI